MRWQAPDGAIWASKFEYGVFDALQKQGYHVSKTTEHDSLAYSDPVRGGRCVSCGGSDCVVQRTYTPDVFVGHTRESVEPGAAEPRPSAAASGGGYYIEAKGYLRADRRRLLRSVRKTWPHIDLRLVIQRDYKVTSKLTLVQWAEKFLKCPVHVWNGGLPKEWKEDRRVSRSA